MKYLIRTEKYIQKYLIYKGCEVILIRKSNFFGMLLLAHMKYRDKNWKKSCRNRYFKFDAVIEAEISNSDYHQERMKTVQIRKATAFNFTQNMRDIFFQDFFQYMNMRLCVKEVRNGNELIVKMVDDYYKLLNMSEDDISSETLVRVYRRHRAKNNEELETLLDFVTNENS